MGKKRGVFQKTIKVILCNFRNNFCSFYDHFYIVNIQYAEIISGVVLYMKLFKLQKNEGHIQKSWTFSPFFRNFVTSEKKMDLRECVDQRWIDCSPPIAAKLGSMCSGFLSPLSLYRAACNNTKIL